MMAENLMEGGEASSSAPEDRREVPHFVCVEFPARVQNVEKMLKTLGGEEKVSKTLSTSSSKKLEMKFRPDEPFCRSLYATKQPATSVLLRVKKRHRKTVGGACVETEVGSEGDDEVEEITENTEEEAEYKTELVGVIDSVYKFKGMCDFQYLPLHKNKDTGLMESLTERIVPSKLEGASFLQQDVPLFMMPPVFSRSDLPSEYHFQPDVVPSTESLSYKVANRLDKNIVGSGRARRPHNTHLVSFEQDETPTAPHPEAVLVVQKGQEREQSIGKLRDELVQLFAERPVWSRSAIKHNCSLSNRQLTVLLPSVSYYFVTGPWRASWVRFGYDPRREPDSLKYQMLDFRVRKSILVNKMGESRNKESERFKRSCYSRHLPTSVQRSNTRSPKSKTMELDKQTPQKDAYYIFREGLVPAYNQMFYQLCDIHHEGIQAFIRAKSTEPGQDRPVRYFKQEVLDQMRSLLNEALKKTLQEEAMMKEDTASEEVGEDDAPGPSTSQDGDADMDDADVDDEEEEEDGLDDGDDNDNDDVEVDGDQIDEEDDSENEMETELLEYLSGT